MAIRQQDLIAMNEQIWSSMLGITIVTSESTEVPLHGASFIGACVQLVGAWQGAVLVDCSRALALRAAQSFQGKREQEVSVDEVRDTVGELANMAAGSLKALLPQPTHISLPSVADGSDYDLTVRRGKVLLQCPFESAGEPLLVSLIEREREAQTAKLDRPLSNRIQ